MTDIAYPTLRIGVLRSLQSLKKHYLADQEIFDRPDCPYDIDVRNVLKEILQIEERVVEVEKRIVNDGSPERRKKAPGLAEEDQEKIAAELAELLEQLKGMEEGEGENELDPSARLAVFKLKTTIIEKIINLRERVLNIKRIAQFEAVVISILDDLVQEDDREVFLERIAPYRED
ncbi:hypothetical protein KNJ79_05310 [Sphingopyxis indica]|uniref:hypothetical protein n=1 Tax=Sphingopyxis indica TaxID=436663 RepID=UPI00293926E6|nr:hypothetical protein [Sphingopyxis indica]WOF44351.1 hypothetical protein KNJ79_05310 [Sphingopyxis indica]